LRWAKTMPPARCCRCRSRRGIRHLLSTLR
jgi:hypothetical protein